MLWLVAWQYYSPLYLSARDHQTGFFVLLLPLSSSSSSSSSHGRVFHLVFDFKLEYVLWPPKAIMGVVTESQQLFNHFAHITPLSAQISASEFPPNSTEKLWCLEQSWCLTQTLTQNLKTHSNFWCRGVNNKHHAAESWDMKFEFLRCLSQIPNPTSPQHDVCYRRQCYNSLWLLERYLR